MIGYKYDDGGRQKAGYKGNAGDCVCRALAIASAVGYQRIYDELSQANKELIGKRSARNGVSIKAYGPVYERHGFIKIKLPKGPRPTFTEAFRKYGDCIVHTTKHICAIVDGNLRDTFDGRTYEWAETMYSGFDFGVETRERKATSIWVRKENAPPVKIELEEDTLKRLRSRFPGMNDNDAIATLLAWGKSS